jgi:flagellar basal body-associated protein FliL
MARLGRKGQGEALIKILVVAIIAIIAIALVKSYFRETSRKAQKTAEEIFQPISTATLILPLFEPGQTFSTDSVT